MSFLIWFSYFIIGFMLFFFVKLFKNRYSIERFDSLLFSLIYLLIVAGVFSTQWPGFDDNIFIVVVFSFIIDLIYNTYFLDKDFFNKNEDNIFYYLVLIGSSFIINQGFFNKVEEVFPTGEDLRVIIWLLVIVYLYKYVRKSHLFREVDYNKTFNFNSEFVIVSFAKLRHKYLDEVKFKDKDIELIIFSIMIYENYKCPEFKRKINNFKFKLDNNKCKLGIMQIETSKFISDVDSINIVSKKIEKLMPKTKKNLESVICKYCGDESSYIIPIYNELVKFSKK